MTTIAAPVAGSSTRTRRRLQNPVWGIVAWIAGIVFADLSAAATLLSLPVLLAGWVAQNKLVRGLSMGAVK